MKEILIKNKDLLHTTLLGKERIEKALNKNDAELISLIIDDDNVVIKNGENYYVIGNDYIVTINSHNYCIITAKKIIKYHMKLNDDPYNSIYNETKTVELRLHDEK